MGWREVFVEHFATGYLGGVTAGNWLRLLRDNRFNVSPRCAFRAAATTVVCPVNSFWKIAERLWFRNAIEKTEVASPLFVLGHWRSGTTHLQELLAADPRFASPSLYEVFFPQTFLTTQWISGPLVDLAVPRTRGFDNVKQHHKAPHEDEIAICSMSGCTPYLTLAFPEAAEFYDRFLTFREAEPRHIRQWRDEVTFFFKKLTFKHQKPLVLKSPTHTARIAMLLEMFPDTRFVHISRNPFEVYRSTMHLLERGLPITRLQRTNGVDWSTRTLRLYREMYDAYFAERGLIPEGRLVEIAYEDLESDPIEQLKVIYDRLSLPPFAEAEPAVRQLLADIGDYKKNRRVDLPTELRKTIADRWAPTFAEFGYATS